MNYSIEQLTNGRWGIYAEQKLLATIGCHQTALRILALLQTGREVKAKHEQISSLRTETGSTNQAA